VEKYPNLKTALPVAEDTEIRHVVHAGRFILTLHFGRGSIFVESTLRLTFTPLEVRLDSKTPYPLRLLVKIWMSAATGGNFQRRKLSYRY
jgi:hypothetical protein